MEVTTIMRIKYISIFEFLTTYWHIALHESANPGKKSQIYFTKKPQISYFFYKNVKISIEKNMELVMAMTSILNT